VKDTQGARGGPMPRHAGEDTGGAWMSWWARSPAEVDAAYALALRQGLTVTRPPTDEPWGVRECHLRRPDGHTFRVSAGTPGEECRAAPTEAQGGRPG
jgi:uncharacterized glyoxalase superfamily protein PhnB